MTKHITIVDVADRAGVSVATVSRALRGLPHVSTGTRRRVQRVAAELGYEPNPHASRLAAGRSGTIGVAVPILDSWYYARVLAGIHSVLAGDQLDMHVVVIADEAGKERFVETLPSLRKRVDGLILVDTFMPDSMWPALTAGGLAVATVGVDTNLFDGVVIDNHAAAVTAADHLLDLGHRRLAYIGGRAGAHLEVESVEQRRRGMLTAMARRGLEADPGLQVEGGFSVAGGHAAMRRLLQGERPSAVLCASDEMALGALQAAAEAGIGVPARLSVVGFDDQPAGRAVGLTTVYQPVSEQAARAAIMVLTRMEERDGPVCRVEMPTRLEVRGTSGPAT